MTPWVWVYRPGDDDLIYDMLTLAAPKQKRDLVRRVIRGTMVIANVAFWLKGFL